MTGHGSKIHLLFWIKICRYDVKWRVNAHHSSDTLVFYKYYIHRIQVCPKTGACFESVRRLWAFTLSPNLNIFLVVLWGTLLEVHFSSNICIESVNSEKVILHLIGNKISFAIFIFSIILSMQNIARNEWHFKCVFVLLTFVTVRFSVLPKHKNTIHVKRHFEKFRHKKIRSYQLHLKTGKQ